MSLVAGGASLRIRAMKATLGLLVFIAALPASAAAPATPFAREDWNCRPGATPILIVGMFHMSNPGQDQYGTKVGDLTGESKQAEIALVRKKLAAFAPTKIAIESPFKGGNAAKDYEAFLAGKYALTVNETDQIGFTLAKELGHKAIHAVDFPMWMDGRVPAEIGKPKPRPAASPEPPSPPSETPAIYREAQARIERDSVLDVLRFLNGWEYTRKDGALYVDNLKPDPYSGDLYETSNLLTNWYKRNLRIFTNVYRVTEPGDRVLILIGSGHNAILRQLAIDSADYCLADADAYLEP